MENKAKQVALSQSQVASKESKESEESFNSSLHLRLATSDLRLGSGFTIDDSHLKGNIFAGVLDENNNEAKKLPRNSQGYQQSQVEVQRKIKTMRQRLHPEDP